MTHCVSPRSNRFLLMPVWKQRLFVVILAGLIFLLSELVSLFALYVFSHSRDFQNHPLVEVFYRLKMEERRKRWMQWNYWYGYRWFRDTVYTEDNPKIKSRDTNQSYSYTTDNLGFIRNDSDPYNDLEIGPKPMGETRIFVLGGSTVAGHTTPPEYSIPAQLESTLNAGHTSNPGHYYRVINAGVSAWGSRQEYIFTVMTISNLEPDIIVVFDGYNDFSHVASWGYGIGSPWSRDAICAYNTPLHRLMLRWHREGRYYRLATFLERSVDGFFRFYTVRVIRGLLNHISGQGVVLANTDPSQKPDAEETLYGEPLPGSYWLKVIPDGLMYYMENLDGIARFCRSRGIRSLFALQPTLAVEEKPLLPEEAKYLDDADKKTNGVLKKEALKWWKGTRGLFLSFEKRYSSIDDIRFIDLSRVFASEEDCMYLSDTCHYTKKGNSLIAKELAETLLSWEIQ